MVNVCSLFLDDDTNKLIAYCQILSLLSDPDTCTFVRTLYI